MLCLAQERHAAAATVGSFCFGAFPGSFVAVGAGGFEDIDELPPVLRPWFRVHPGYLDDLTLVRSEFVLGILRLA